MIDETEVTERNKLEQVNNPPEEIVCNDDVDMTVESLADDNSASFRKLKVFPVVSNELTFLKSTPHHGKEQPLLDELNLNNECNLNNKSLEIKDIGSSYQIIDLDILASTYSANASPDCFNTSCQELKMAKKQGLCCNFVYRARYVNFAILFGHQTKLRK